MTFVSKPASDPTEETNNLRFSFRGPFCFFFPGDFSVFSSKKTSWKLFYDSMMLDALFFSPAQLHAANLPSIGVISTFQPNPKV